MTVDILLNITKVIMLIFAFLLLFGFLSLVFMDDINRLKRKICKINRNRYLYKLLQNYNAEYSLEKFLAYFADYFLPDSKTYFDPLKQKQKNICFDAFRFALGLTTINIFDEDKNIEIVSFILSKLTMSTENISDEYFLKNENIIICGHRLLKAIKTPDIHMSPQPMYIYKFVFEDMKTEDVTVVKIPDKNLECEIKYLYKNGKFAEW